MDNVRGKASVTGYYEADHERLDRLFKMFQTLKRSDFAKAKGAFVDFKTGLQRHIVWEEEILFPVFEEKTGIKDAGPTAVMRLEHREIGAALEAVHQKVKERDPESDREEEKLISLLSEHNRKEEVILYPAIDRFLSPAELEEIFKKMEALPPERYATCCGGH
ncbi:MAG: hemerythrin domain-containing protein [Deltaproteobacteria bacterium]|nr:hemerythrin domain-containing protein [Deltaproteobacteria bacterium]